MSNQIEPKTFEEWIEAIFNHPTPLEHDDAWYWGDTYVCVNDPALSVGFYGRLFNEGGERLKHFSDDQVGYGLEYLINNSCSDEIFAFTDSRVEVDARTQALLNIPTFFQHVMIPRTREQLSHLVREEMDTSTELENICYMWWDVCPLHPMNLEKELVDTCLEVMRQTLTLSHLACRESALHGLGEWHGSQTANRIEAIIDEFIAKNPNMDPDLLSYAKCARRGYVQ